MALGLHYLLLCVFCWMLAEGIMLYLLLVRVFGNAAQKWNFLLALGWGEFTAHLIEFVAVRVILQSSYPGLPILIVAVSFGIRHDHYGNDNL